MIEPIIGMCISIIYVFLAVMFAIVYRYRQNFHTDGEEIFIGIIWPLYLMYLLAKKCALAIYKKL